LLSLATKHKRAGGSVTLRQLEGAARFTPFLILIYFAIQFVIRVAFSGNLETDEAEFVGQTYLALGYGNSHPPLYNWLVRGALELTGSWPAAVALVKNLLLIGTYLLSYDIARRVTGRPLTGLILIASFMLLPQIVWKSQITLTHSVIVMFAVVATLHAVVLIAQRGGAGSFLWLGLAAAIGALAKYNFFIMLVAILAATALVPSVRGRLFNTRLLYSFGLFSVLCAPHLIWAVQHIGGSTARMAKLERTDTSFGVIDVPFLGVDGLLTLIAAVIAWAGPLVAVWFALRLLSGDRDAGTDREDVGGFASFFGLATMIGVVGFAAIVLLGDFHSVQERYFTPLLIALPLWLVLSWPIDNAVRPATHFLRIAAAIAILMVTAWPLWIVFGREQLAYPYAAFAAALPRTEGVPMAVLTDRNKYAANIAIRLKDGAVWGEIDSPQEVAIIWRQKSDQPPAELVATLGPDYEPRSAVLALSFPYDNLSGQTARLMVRIYARKP
jgi:4-amino-4-deoxy-L-arabinose transferase-like glycosyltransferase